MIYKSIRGDDHKQEFLDKYYNTVDALQLQKFPQSEKKKAVGVCLRH